MKIFCVLTCFLGLVVAGCGRNRGELEALRAGFVVWESNRTGAWRIFRKDLGTGRVRQLSPEEPGRSHVAAHISPEGRRVVYLSYPEGMDGYRRQGEEVVVPMWVVEADGRGEARVLIGNARAYGEHRAAVWLSERELVYVDERYQTRVMDVETGEGRALIAGRPGGVLWDHGYLPDPTLRYATSGVPNFGWLEGEERRFVSRGQMEGCQPFFTREGAWGYWMGGVGGPLMRVRMASGEMEAVLERDDARMPAGWGYLYFPHISACRRALVIGASPGEHDHNRADYELFLLPLDAGGLAVSGAAVRLTRDGGTDRFPEIFLAGQGEAAVAEAAPVRGGGEDWVVAEDEAEPGGVSAERWRVRARLRAVTPVPTPEEIVPYREGLVVFEYEVLAVETGAELPEVVRVVHWAVLEGEAQELPAVNVGEVAVLDVEPMAAHAHLENRFMADALDLDLDTPVLLDVGL